MSDRRKLRAASDKKLAYVAAGLVHAAIIGALIFNFTSAPESIEAVYAEKVDVVNATTIDESEIKKHQDKLKQQDLQRQKDKERERRDLQKLQEKAKQEEQRIEELKDLQKQEQEKAEQLEQQRKEIALKKQQEEAQRKQEALARKKAEEELKRKQEAEEAEKRKRERALRQEMERIEREEAELQARRELNERLAREESMIRAQQAKQRAASLGSKYAALIKRKVEPKITISPDFSPSLSSKINVKLSSSGDVRSVRIIESSGNFVYDKAVETAIFASSPLPIPSQSEDPEVNIMFQDLTLNFSLSGR